MNTKIDQRDAQVERVIQKLAEVLAELDQINAKIPAVQVDMAMNYLIEQGVEQFFEIGPGKVLKGLLKRINRKMPCENVIA